MNSMILKRGFMIVVIMLLPVLHLNWSQAMITDKGYIAAVDSVDDKQKDAIIRSFDGIGSDSIDVKDLDIINAKAIKLSDEGAAVTSYISWTDTRVTPANSEDSVDVALTRNDYRYATEASSFAYTTSITINLYTGWNSVSSPGIPVISDWNTIIADNPNIAFVITYDATEKKFVNATDIEFGKSYFIGVYNNTQITLEYYSKDSPSLPEQTNELRVLAPSNGAIGVDKTVNLTVEGGEEALGSDIVLPLQYSFEIDESSSFGSLALQKSSWQTHHSQWTPILKPNTTYYWRAKVRDSANSPKESNWTSPQNFQTEGPSIWYVRPQKQGKYGTGDGKSYDNAFNGIGNPAGVNWGKVGAGDTLYLCDKHVSSIMGIAFYIGASGLNAEYPIMIRGDLPGYPFINEFRTFTIIMKNRKFITFKNLIFNKFYLYGDGATTDITFDGCEFNSPGGGISYIDLWPGNDRWTFLNNTFQDGKNGIYTHYRQSGSNTRLAANYLTVRNNKFIHMIGGGDSHAIGMQGGQGHIIEGNYIEDTGSAIQFWTDGSYGPPMGGMIVRGNFIKDVHRDSMGSAICIYDNMENPLAGRLDYIIDHNIVINAWGAGIYFATIENRPFQIYNNILMNAGTNGYRVGIGVVLRKGVNGVGAIYNNIVVDPGSYFISVSTQKYIDLKIDNNLYFSTTPGKKWFSRIVRNFFSDYQGTGFDTHGMNVDPQFVSDNPLDPEDFRLKPTSPAINAGKDWVQIRDFFGNPIQGAPDIGAIEFQ